MQIILLEKVEKLGEIGSLVTVKNGFARNFLFPRKKAVRATKENIALVEQRRAELEQENAERKAAAQTLHDQVNGVSVVLIRQAAEDGRLFGSVTSRDIAAVISQKSGAPVTYEHIILNTRFKELGSYDIEVTFHPEVKAHVSLVIARNESSASEMKSEIKSNSSEE